MPLKKQLSVLLVQQLNKLLVQQWNTVLMKQLSEVLKGLPLNIMKNLVTYVYIMKISMNEKVSYYPQLHPHRFKLDIRTLLNTSLLTNYNEPTQMYHISLLFEL